MAAQHKFSGLSLAGILCMGAIALTNSPAAAQIVPDDTLGAERSQVRPDRIQGRDSDRIEGGALRGDNLFHSFEQFNVGEGRGAYFANPTGIENIFSRVTGNDASTILGRLGVLGNANLFLINPNGVLFGANASLDVGGSFTATTASAIQFGDRDFFSAANPSTPSALLTINPTAFLFTQASAGAIENRSTASAGTNAIGIEISGLRVPDGEALTLLGGNVRLNRGRLNAFGGRVEVGAVDGAGTIGLSANSRLVFPNSIDRANISLTNGALIGVIGADDGSIAMTAQNFNISEGSSLIAGILAGLGSEEAQAGNIRLDATGSIRINQAFIVNEVSQNSAGEVGIGSGGSIYIDGRSLVLTDSFLTTSTFGRGAPGEIRANVDNQISLFNSQILSAVGEQGAGLSGDIRITAGGQVTLDQQSLISNNARDLTFVAGEIRIDARSLHIFNNSQIETAIVESSNPQQSFSIGQGGNIIINVAEEVEIFEPSRQDEFFTGINTGVQASALGIGGNIVINAQSLTLTNGSVSTSNLAGVDNELTTLLISLDPRLGQAGNIQINVDQLTAFNSDIAAVGTGVGGDITIDAETISLRGDSDIQTLTALTEGGNIAIDANSIVAFDDSDIRAFSLVGRGGNIELQTPAFFAENYRPSSQDSSRSDLQGTGSLFERVNSLGGGELDAFGRERSALEANGQVDIDASGIIAGGAITLPDISLIQNSLVEISETAIDTDQLLVNSCITRSNTGGTFLITGSDGLPERPGDEITSPYSTGTVRSIPSESREVIEEPQGIYPLPDGRLVMSRECGN